jgi:hypothetical protein
MNIFRVDNNPFRAAEMLCDKHVVKMVLETAQLLSSAHHMLDTPVAPKVYKLTHKNHPCALWVRSSKRNYSWTLKHFMALLHEYTYRYGKTHKSARLLPYFCQSNVLPIKESRETDPPQCVYDDCKDDDVVKAYQKYYAARSKEIDMRWTKREVPKFMR